MQKLQKYAQKSSLMDIRIRLDNGEKFTFNLFEELLISEDRLNYEATEQPSSYAFLGMVYRQLVKALDDRKLEKEKAWATAYIDAKKSTNPDTGRPYPDDMAKAMAEVSKEYLEAAEAYNMAKYKAGILESCVNAFEQRSSLIQTISANNRKQ